ncbi:hypothetical protein CPB85DRAFT_1253404 [Mucidula mucida]|nr:hypothetical protein CPB85DRAFT_1253404 [Mucidula mucida]
MNGKTLDLFPMLESSSEVHLGTASDDSLNRVREQRAPIRVQNFSNGVDVAFISDSLNSSRFGFRIFRGCQKALREQRLDFLILNSQKSKFGHRGCPRRAGLNLGKNSGFDSFWVNKTADGDLDLATFGFGHLANSIVIAVSVSSGAADAVPTMHLLDYRHRFDADLDLTDLGFTHGFGHVDGELVPRHTWNIAQSTWDDIRLNGTGLDSGRTRLLYAVTINYPRPQNVGFTTSGISSHLQ